MIRRPDYVNAILPFAMDKLAIGNDEGIAFVHIADFLLMDKW